MYKLILSISILTLSIASCKKPLSDVNDYFAKVTTVSATVQTDGSVLIEGKVESEGAEPIQYLGVVSSTTKEPTLLNRQVPATTYSTDGKFTTILTGGFNVDSVYYFRTWAANSFGYTYGNTVSLSKIIAAPITAPCTLTLNKCNIGSPSYTYTSATAPQNQWLTEWTVVANTSGGLDVNYVFGSPLTTGVYTTTAQSNSIPAGRVYISFGFPATPLNSGSKVYVNTVAPKVYEITVCNAPWSYSSGGTVNSFSSRLKSPF
jgi:hypothetical protein